MFHNNYNVQVTEAKMNFNIIMRILVRTYIKQGGGVKVSKSECVIGIDYGTQSGGTVIVDIKYGRKTAIYVTVYRIGVIDDY
ncbi:Ribulokinase [Clostridium vincentii]|uniref:Ribulokinase n=1 Tax=Clostridium vincentii TaxID=52704 RepID=A0A2T0BHH3_9CLOT|nr:Ribulokinase [Clostridium vincentii]